MSSQPPPTPDLEFDCPLCGGAFEVSSVWLGHEVECPHCGGSVELEAAEPTAVGETSAAMREEGAAQPLAGAAVESAALSVTADRETPAGEAPAAKPPVSQAPAAEPAPPPKPRPAITAEQREALRRRVNRVVAIGGVLILCGAAGLLLWLGQ